MQVLIYFFWKLRLLLPILFSFFVSLDLNAGNIRASIDLREAVVGDVISLQYEVEGSLEGDIPPPSIDGVRSQGSGTSTNMSWINGSYSKKTTYSFSLVAQRSGNFIIPSIKVLVDGQSLSTQELSFRVRNPGQKLYGSKQQKAPLAFIERSVSTQNPYLGESVQVDVKVYHRVELANAETIGEDSSQFRYIKFKQMNLRERRGDVIYDVISLPQMLVPLVAGKVVLPAYQLNIGLVLPNQRRNTRRDIFSDFFGASRQVQRRTIASKELVFQVKDIPQKGRPQDFSGVVGDFKALGSLSPKSLKVGETSTLTIALEGEGLLNSMPAIKLDLGKKVKVYEDKPEYSENYHMTKGVLSKKSYKFAVVPLKPGSIDLHPYTFSYFNPKTSKFVSKK